MSTPTRSEAISSLREASAWLREDAGSFRECVAEGGTQQPALMLHMADQRERWADAIDAMIHDSEVLR